MPAKATPTVVPEQSAPRDLLRNGHGLLLPYLIYVRVTTGNTLRIALTMSLTSSFENLGSMITPPVRSRMSIVRGQQALPYSIALPSGLEKEGHPG